VWPVEAGYEEGYERMVRAGRGVAGQLSACIVGIARNAMPNLANTLPLVEEVRSGFAESSVYFYENDSTDDTAAVLNKYAAERQGVTVEHDTLGFLGEDTRGFEPDRTIRLAACRNRCHDWVRQNASKTAWTIVLDVDPDGGFSVDGVFNSIAWLGLLGSSSNVPQVGGMAAYSLLRTDNSNGTVGYAHYDAWAARPLQHWEDRRQKVGFMWFSGFLPPVGSQPGPFNSVFGGLCVYRTKAYLAAGEQPYEGGDCEHVFLHKKMKQAGYQLYLNPGMRYISIWR
jgi:hypothetical protein